MASAKVWTRAIEYADAAKNVVLAYGAAAYILGFLITSVHMGSLGAFGVEILRSRYILTGLLFSLFLATIVFPLRGLLLTVRRLQSAAADRTDAQNVGDTVSGVLIFSLFAWGPIYVAVSSLATWTSSNSTLLVASSERGQQWALNATTSLMFGVILFALLAIGDRITRRSNTGLGNPRSLFLRCIVFLACFVVVNLSYHFLSTFVSPASSSESEGWDLFVLVPFSIYAFFAALVPLLRFTNEASVNEGAEVPSETRPFYAAWMLSLAGGVVLSAYATQIYPRLPGQIGGGHPSPVHVVLAKGVREHLGDLSHELAVLDRTTSSTLFISRNGGRVRVFEVANEQILSLEFLGLSGSSGEVAPLRSAEDKAGVKAGPEGPAKTP